MIEVNVNNKNRPVLTQIISDYAAFVERLPPKNVWKLL